MAGIKKTFKERGKMALNMAVKKPWKAHDIGQSFKHGVDDLGGMFTPDIPIPKEEPIIEMPNEGMLKLASKRARAKKMGTGRNSTILTEGLGG